MRRLPIVGVMGSGRESHTELAVPLGRWLARRPVHLLTGGGSGVMSAVSRAFVEVEGRAGLSLGVLPASPEDPGRARPGYPNPWIEVVIRTHLPLSGEEGTAEASRNHVNVLSADVLVVLPGGAGTASEVELALRYGRPLVAFGSASLHASLPSAVPRMASQSGVQRFVQETLAPASAER